MDAGDLHGEEFLSLEQVVQVCLCGSAVDVATVWIDRAEIHLPLLVAHVHRTIVGEEHGVATIAGWHHAVEHIDTSLDGFEDVLWCTYSHQVARLVLWQNLVDHLYHLIHHLGRFSYGKTADGISVCSLVGNKLGCFSSQLWEGTTLHDREETLVVTIERFGLIETLETTVQPALCHLKALLGILEVALSWRTLVESHHDVGTDDALCVHHVLWGKDMFASVDMRTELATFLSQLTDTGERENLETTTVGEDRTLPAIESMQAACCLHDLKSWTEVEVIGIAQDNLSLHLVAKLVEVDSLHRTYGSHRHEDWSLDLSVVGGDDASAGIACLICYL